MWNFAEASDRIIVMSSGDSNPAATPTPCEDIHGDGRWISLHNRFVSDSKGKEPDVLFVGDSLVQLMHEFEVWRKLFSPLHSLNFGIGGDATQHVLWRLTNGELDQICPKVVVLWVGTNNHGHTPEQICGGIVAIANVINNHLPQTHVLVLGVLPRGKSPNPLRERNAQVNTLVQAELASLSYASFLDVDPGFVQSDGSISHQDLYDYLHLTAQAYQKVCQPIYTRIKALLGTHAP
ncbi:hypothetical protein Q7C36_006988 [Tachysurus vachellii]|uniref:Platelet-activating factor acetylhydrolase IB subunit alpha1 n=2 Tax=Tachysurus vachellii TaxID=175792 RepID=A0AA88NFY3_TACVA|nr:hypothetical protein Q7C36_006988 [Tachysurus vachellii]